MVWLTSGDETTPPTPPFNSIGCGATCSCPELGTEPFDMYLPYYDKTITIPPIPTNLAHYDYATEEALMAIPKACAEEYADSLNESVSINDRQPYGPTGMAYLRLSGLIGGYQTLKSMLDTCAFGLVVAMHGSGGPGWDTVSSAAMFSASGFLVVMLDSQAMPDDLELKGRRPLKPISEINMDNFCGSYNAYDASCSAFNKPFCYSTKRANVLGNPDKYRMFTQRLYHIRKFELDYFIQNEGNQLLSAARKVFLFGSSEGGMVLARYHHASLDAVLSGRIIMSAGCDFNYFTPCPEAAQVCEHQCRKDVPQLNFIGDNDGYFGRHDGSVSRDVADNETMGFGGPITGNCKAAYDAYGFTQTTVVEIKDAGHGPMYWNDNVMRGIFADFVTAPTRDSAEWGSLNVSTCAEEDGVWRCEPESPFTCTEDYTVDPNAKWDFRGEQPVEGCGTQCACPALGTESFDMYLPHHKKTITVPPIPIDLAHYDYATEEALVAIPKACVDEYASSLNETVPFSDRQPEGETGMAYLRMSSGLADGYQTLRDMLNTCACGLVVSMHGTGGPGWDTVSSAAMFAASGFIVVMLDSQAMPDNLELKGKRPLKPISEINMDNFCGGYSAYEGSCSNFNKPFCYTTRRENILANPNKYRMYMQRIYHIRKFELDYFVQNEGSELLAAAKKVFLFGNSEGSIIVTRYHHASLDAVLSGRIIMSAGCDFSYFTPCPEAVQVCEHQCREDVPQLNFIGDQDGYFGRQDGSVSRDVADDTVRGFGGPVTGNCKAAYDTYGFNHSTVVEIKDAGHGPMYWNDNVMRGIFADFVNTPTADASTWSSLSIDSCTLVNGVYKCDSEDPYTCTSEYTVDPNARWDFRGTPPNGCAAVGGADVTVSASHGGPTAARASAVAAVVVQLV